MGKSKSQIKPGEVVEISGQYHVPGRKEVTLVKGKPAPPTPTPGHKYTLVDKTRHKG